MARAAGSGGRAGQWLPVAACVRTGPPRASPARRLSLWLPGALLGSLYAISAMLHLLGGHFVEMGGHTCIPATVTISAVLAGGQASQVPPGCSQPCCGRRGCGSRHICPISSQRSCLQKWRTCSRTTSYQRNGIVASGKSSLAYPRGPCLQYCLSICGNTWTDALHAAHF